MSVLDILTSGNETMTMVAGIGIIISFIVLAGTRTRSAPVMAFAGVCGTMLVTVIGMVPAWISVITALIIIFAIFVKASFGGVE